MAALRKAFRYRNLTKFNFAAVSNQFHSKALREKESFIAKVEDDEDKRLMKIIWQDGRENLYPHLFLRDHCQCEECFHPSTKSRKLDTIGTVDIDITISDIEYDGGNDGKLSITWPDNHKSVFDADWLLSRAFPPKDAESIPDTTDLNDLSMVAWDTNMIKKQLPFVDYDTITKNESKLKEHLENLLRYGFSIIRKSPKDMKVLKSLADLMCLSIISKTNYG